MDAFVTATWMLMVQLGTSNAISSAPITNTVAAAPAVVVPKSIPMQARCDARPYQRLVGRTVSDLLTARLPQGARIYRIDDPQTEPVVSGRLSVELNRSTRVRRVYCS